MAGMDDDRAEDQPLPAFGRPPVAEVALSVGFDPLAGLSVLDIYDFYRDRYLARFPTTEDKVPYAMPIERFGTRARVPDVRLEVIDQPSMLRHWFISEDNSELIQVQSDWFGRNWRKPRDDFRYQRYPSIRSPFVEDLTAFGTFAKDRGRGELVPTQAEITYVNHIQRDGIWSTHGEVAKVVRYWDSWDSGPFPERPEQVQFAVSYLIPSAESPIGRLHVNLQPAFSSDSDEPIFVLNLTARGRVAERTIEGALEFLDLGRDWIVRCFAEITTTEMHVQWEREL